MNPTRIKIDCNKKFWVDFRTAIKLGDFQEKLGTFQENDYSSGTATTPGLILLAYPIGPAQPHARYSDTNKASR